MQYLYFCWYFCASGFLFHWNLSKKSKSPVFIHYENNKCNICIFVGTSAYNVYTIVRPHYRVFVCKMASRLPHIVSSRYMLYNMHIMLFYLLYLPATKWISGLNEMGGIWNQIGPKPIFFYGHLDFITFCAAHLQTWYLSNLLHQQILQNI